MRKFLAQGIIIGGVRGWIILAVKAKQTKRFQNISMEVIDLH